MPKVPKQTARLVFNLWNGGRQQRAYRASAAGKSSGAWRTRKSPFRLRWPRVSTKHDRGQIMPRSKWWT